MNWSDIGGLVGKAAPLLGGLVGGKAGSAVGGMIASALGVEAQPDAVAERLQADPEALAKVRQMELDNQAELTRLNLEAETNRLTEINKTMRAEAASDDAYVRRWRPTYGYVTCATWFIQMSALSAAIIAASFVYPEQAGSIMTGLSALMGSLMARWAIALSVLGVNVSKRSQDKQVAAGQAPGQGVLGALSQRLAGKGAR